MKCWRYRYWLRGDVLYCIDNHGAAVYKKRLGE
jgi:hypothetical protein